METNVEIIKVYRQEVPELRFIGKKYGDSDRVNGMFGKHWGDWHQNGWFDIIDKSININMNTVFEDGNAAIGLMRDKEGVFEYWIGKFMPKETNVPDGFAYQDFPKGALGVCWLYGKEDFLYKNEGKCAKKLEESGNKFKCVDGSVWCFERYTDSRFEADEKGNVILDLCFFCE
jgi:hypothetical protein